jgi:hypothetical protein
VPGFTNRQGGTSSRAGWQAVESGKAGTRTAFGSGSFTTGGSEIEMGIVGWGGNGVWPPGTEGQSRNELDV